MNPGLSEEAGKAAASTIDALKSTPVVLALVVFNVIFMILMAYLSIKSSEHNDRESARWQTFAENALKACQPAQPR